MFITTKARRAHRTRALAGIVAFVAFASACSSSSSSSSSSSAAATSPTSAAAGATTVASASTAAAATSPTATTGSTVGSTTAAAATTAAGGTGAPAGEAFKVDTSKCTDPASVTAKVTGSWKVGYSAPLSGPVAGVVTYALDGFKARIAAANAADEVKGVKIDVTYKDDQFTPDKAKANATEFLQSDHVNSLLTFGSGPVGAIADDQNADCVPLLYPSSSVQKYRDISQYPWTVQYLPAGDAEARYDIGLITSKFPSGAKVGIAENQTASGKGESAAFQAAAKGTNLTIAVVAPSTDPNAAATQLKAANVDVVYDAGISSDCGPVVQAMDRIGFTPKVVINPSNCADSTAYVASGKAADGNVIPSFLKNPASAALANDAGVKMYLSQVTTDDKNNAITVAGWVTADLLVNTLKQAAASSGGLSRLSAIQAARNQKYASPMFIDGINWESTATTLTGIDAFQTTVWNAADQSFHLDGSLISVAAK